MRRVGQWQTCHCEKPASGALLLKVNKDLKLPKLILIWELELRRLPKASTVRSLCEILTVGHLWRKINLSGGFPLLLERKKKKKECKAQRLVQVLHILRKL